jgi:hypothetical protein
LRARTRAELAAEALVRPGGLLSRLGPDTPALVFGYADRAWPLGTVRPADPAATRPGGPPADPDGEDLDDGTDDPPDPTRIRWASSLLPLPPPTPTIRRARGVASAMAAAATTSPSAACGDRATGNRSAARPAGRRGGALPPGVPLIAVAAAGPAPPPDVSVTDVACPPTAFAGETIVVRARVQGTGGLPADAAALRVSVDGTDVTGPATAPADKPAGKRDDAAGSARFGVTLDRRAWPRWRSRPRPRPARCRREQRVRRYVKVQPERIRVAAYTGSRGNRGRAMACSAR